MPVAGAPATTISSIPSLKFRGVNHLLGEWLDEIATRAASQNEQYLEIMHTPGRFRGRRNGEKVGYHADFAQYRKLMLDAGLRDSIPAISAELDKAEAQRHEIEGCGKPGAKPACESEISYLYQVLRAFPPDSSSRRFACFELASATRAVSGSTSSSPKTAMSR